MSDFKHKNKKQLENMENSAEKRINTIIILDHYNLYLIFY
jgi:hypothetical protein